MKQLLSLFKILLYPFTLAYGAIVWLRNRLYDSGFMSSVEFDLPVIAVGNLSVGGTGKTPHVEYLVCLLQPDYKVATMSRGYKRRTKGFVLAGPNTTALSIGDEPMQYHLKFPELAVSVAEERMTGIPLLLQRRPETDLILLDDAYQHRSVKAGMNILITDYARPFYSDYILPYGRLREGRGAYKRAHLVVVSKCPPALSTAEAKQIAEKINPLPHQQVFFSTIRYAEPYNFFDRTPAGFKGKHVILVCGIAKPEPMIRHVEQDASQVHVLNYPDHHYFTARNLEEIKETLQNAPAGAVLVTTEKDATRLHLHAETIHSWNVPLIVLPIEVAVLFDRGPELNELVRNFVVSALPDSEESATIDL